MLESVEPTAKTSACCCASAAKRTAMWPGASQLHVVDVIDDDATLQPAVDHPFDDALYLRHAGVATTAGHSNVIVSPAKPGPHAKVRLPNAAPQSVESTYVYAELVTVGAFADSAAPMEVAPAPPVGVTRLLEDTDVPPGAATALRPPPDPVVVVDATTPVKLVTVVLSRDTRAAPAPPRTYFATMPFKAAAGVRGQTTDTTGCEKPRLPTSTVAVCSASSHLTMDKSRNGTVKLNANTPAARATGAPPALTATLRTRESRGRIGSKSTAVVGRADVAVSALLAALAALVPPTAAITASAADAPTATPSARRIRWTGEFASALAAVVAVASCASLTATGAAYTSASTPAASLSGLTPHCVIATPAPGNAAARRAASAADDEILGGGCALTMLAGSVTRPAAAAASAVHGFSAGASASVNAPPAGFIAVVVTPFPQYVLPGVVAAACADVNDCGRPAGVAARRDVTNAPSALLTLFTSATGEPPSGRVTGVSKALLAL